MNSDWTRYGEPTSLYRHFDASGRLLYVGISLSPIARLIQHVGSSSWAADISSVTIENFRSRAEAHEAERLAIAKEDPLHNVVRYCALMEQQACREPVEVWHHSPRRAQLIAEGKLTQLDSKRWEECGRSPAAYIASKGTAATAANASLPSRHERL